MSVNNEKGSLETVGSADRNATLTNVTVSVVIVSGVALAIFGIAHFVPQWTHLPNWSVNVSYMTMHQLSLNPFAFSALTLGTAIVVMMAAKIINEKITKAAKKHTEDSESLSTSTIVKHLSLIAITAVAATILLILATHAYNHLNAGPLTLHSWQTVMAVSQAKLQAILSFGTTGAAAGGLGIYTLARFIHLLATKASQHENPNNQRVVPYLGHDDL